MLKILSLLDLHKAIQSRVEDKTDVPCLDDVPENQPAPFYFVEVVGKEPDNTKTMMRDRYTVYIHAIASSKARGSVEIYKLINALEEALSEYIALPEPFWLVDQINHGLIALKEDETQEKHAVVQMEFIVCYGFLIK